MHSTSQESLSHGILNAPIIYIRIFQRYIQQKNMGPRMLEIKLPSIACQIIYIEIKVNCKWFNIDLTACLKNSNHIHIIIGTRI